MKGEEWLDKVFRNMIQFFLPFIVYSRSMERMKPFSGLILKKTSPGWVSLFKDICF